MKVETYLTARCKEILDLLIVANEHMTIDEIARVKMVSKRSVYYDLCKINEWLEFYKIPLLEVERGKGIYLTPAQSSGIAGLSDQMDSKTGYVLSPSERVCVQMCMIGNSTEVIRLEELAEYCQVSRNTVINDLKVVLSLLLKYQLTLEYKPLKGYYIGGDAVRRRSVCLYCFHQVVSLYNSGILQLFELDRVEVQDYLERFYAIAGNLRTSYQDEMLFGFISLIPVMKMGTEKLDMKNILLQRVTESREYGLVTRYFPALPEQEQIYLAIHLLGSQVEAVEGEETAQLYASSCALVSEFEKEADIRFETEAEVERTIFMHLKSAWPRLIYGIRAGNALLAQDMVRCNINLFEVTKKACGYLENELGLPIPDSEISCLALNFAGYMKQSEIAEDKLRVLVVCRLGTVAGYLIAWEIRSMFPGVRIVGMVPHQAVFNVKDICDMVVSTVLVKSDVPVILVHPILTDRERLTIVHTGTKIVLERRRVVPDVDCEELLEVVKKYVPEECLQQLQCDLYDYFDKKQQSRFRLPLSQARGLGNYLTKTKVRLSDHEYSWEEALRYVAEPLVNNGSIEPTYVDSIIALLNTMGPYMFFVPWLILAHAKPGAEVHKLDVSMGIFKKPVYFSKHRQAKIIILLAPIDKDSHMEIIKDIMTIFAVQNRIDDLQHLETPGEVLKQLLEYCSSQQN